MFRSFWLVFNRSVSFLFVCCFQFFIALNQISNQDESFGKCSIYTVRENSEEFNWDVIAFWMFIVCNCVSGERMALPRAERLIVCAVPVICSNLDIEIIWICIECVFQWYSYLLHNNALVTELDSKNVVLLNFWVFERNDGTRFFRYHWLLVLSITLYKCVHYRIRIDIISIQGHKAFDNKYLVLIN